MKSALTCFSAVVLAVAALPAHADPTPEQRTQLENCKIMSGAVFEFAQARDRKQAKMDAFKAVTHGQAYVPGSLLDETLQWAYAHPDEQPDTAGAHFYDRCVLDTYDARSPDTEGELDIAAQGCQQGHPGAPEAVRDCIDDKTQDIVTRTQLALAAATTTAPATVSAVATTPAPNATTLVAAATPPLTQAPPSPPPSAATVVAVTQASPPVQAASVSGMPVSTPAAKPAVATPAPAVPTQTIASAPPLPASKPAAIAVAPVTPTPQSAPAAVAAPTSEPVVAPAPTLQAAAPVAVSQTSVEPSATVAVESPSAPAVAQAAPPPLPAVPPASLPTQVTPSVSAPAKVAAPAAVVAKAAAPATSLPPLPSAAAMASGPPPDLAGFGKLTVGMPMDEAYKAMGSHGDIEWDQQGEVHTYMIGDDHGFIEIRPSASGTLYSIRVVGGADAHVAPVLNVVLGDGAFVLINNVGLPSSRTPLPGDKELWNYLGRNYAFEISPGGDVIGLRIIDTSYVRIQDR